MSVYLDHNATSPIRPEAAEAADAKAADAKAAEGAGAAADPKAGPAT